MWTWPAPWGRCRPRGGLAGPVGARPVLWGVDGPVGAGPAPWTRLLPRVGEAYPAQPAQWGRGGPREGVAGPVVVASPVGAYPAP